MSGPESGLEIASFNSTVHQLRISKQNANIPILIVKTNNNDKYKPLKRGRTRLMYGI